ncbi:hypothetical protein ACHAXA_007357 [Cyclostephanos tholiformis]|uniref:Bromo domain-containing protein n=1 Tax=Cyclostephanos tholiformis TaxID=382380 RepID=A0ABD3RW21_9STRA
MSGSDASYHDDDDDDDDDGGRGAENLVVDKDVNDADDAAAHVEELAQSLRKMGKIVNNLIARADSVPFREPVDWKGLQLYDYPKIITKMMDLGTIRTKLKKSKYACASECAEDVRQVWENCMTYNDDGSDFYRLAHSYSRRFEERYQKLIDEYGEDIICGGSSERNDVDDDDADYDPLEQIRRKSRSSSLTSSGRHTPHFPAAANPEREDDGDGSGASVSASKAAKKSSKDNIGSTTTSDIVPLDVRTRFAARLQRLSGMELGYVMSVIDIQCPEALEDPAPESLTSDAPPLIHGHRYAWDEFDGGCQIEIDVDSIPPSTFWDLDRYVKEKVQGRGRGAWNDDVTEAEPGGGGGKRRKVKGSLSDGR